MKTCTGCNQPKPETEFHKNSTKKDGLASRCKSCAKLKWEERREKELARRRQHRIDNPEHYREVYKKRAATLEYQEYAKSYGKRYAKENSKKIVARVAEWKVKNPERRKELERNRYQRKKAMYHEHVYRRRARMNNATPAWSNVEVVRSFYQAVAILNSHCGPVKYSVDHIVPLNSPLVSGLHAHTNLTIIPLPENKAKNNRHWPDMP